MSRQQGGAVTHRMVAAGLLILGTVLAIPAGAVPIDVTKESGVTITARSVYDVNAPERAIDGIMATYWVATQHGTPGVPQWLKITLPGTYLLSRFDLFAPDIDGIHLGYNIQYELYAGVWPAADAGFGPLDLTFVGAGTLVDSGDPAVNSDSHVLGSPIAANSIYYAVVGGSHWAHLYELQAWGTGDREDGEGSVPVPATLALAALGLAGLLLGRRRRR